MLYQLLIFLIFFVLHIHESCLGTDKLLCLGTSDNFLERVSTRSKHVCCHISLISYFKAIYLIYHIGLPLSKYYFLLHTLEKSQELGGKLNYNIRQTFCVNNRGK